MSQYGPEHWDAADIEAFKKHTAGNVWGADGYTIPDPVTGQRVHPNTMLRAIRTDTSVLRKTGFDVDLDAADLDAIADSIAADINALPDKVVDRIKARL